MLIRSMETSEISTVVGIYVDTFKATARAYVTDTFMNSLTHENARQRFEGILNKEERRPFSYVAEHDGKIVGYAIGALAGNPPKGYEGELKTIYILPSYHRMGIGRKLIGAVAEHFDRDMVAQSMFLGVFKDNEPARRFYKALRGREIDEQLVEIRGEKLIITIYGWLSVRGLLES